MEQWKWAFRNIWRQKRRTLLNASALSLGMTLLFLGMGWMGGYNAFLFRGVQDFDTGQAQLVRADYLAEERRLPVDKLIDDYEGVQKKLQATDGVLQASGRVDFAAKLSFHGHSAHLMVRALDFVAERGVTVLKDQVRKGSYPTGTGLLVGQSLAKKWGLEPGQTVFITAFDRMGAENFISVRVEGLFAFGYAPLDDQVVYLDLPTAWSLLDTLGQVSRVVVRLKPGLDPDQWVEQKKAELKTNQGDLFSWKRFARETIDAVNADGGSFSFLLAVVFVLATLGMLNSLSMSIHERRRELGTLRALGMRRKQVLGLILREGFALGLFSTLITIVLSLVPALWLATGGLDLKPYLPPDLPFPFGDRFYAVFSPSTYLFTLIAGWLAAILGAWIPAIRASKIRVVDALSSRS